MKIKARVYVTQRDNDRFFAQKLNTSAYAFCYITRGVYITVDPDGVYTNDGEYGHIVAGGKKVQVIRTKAGEYEIA